MKLKFATRKSVPAKKTVDTLITCPGDVVKLFHDLQDETKEKLITVNLDNQNKILCFEVIAIGSVNGIHIRPMEVFRTAFPVNARGAIVLHNHPSGDPTPSEEDKAFTQKWIVWPWIWGLNSLTTSLSALMDITASGKTVTLSAQRFRTYTFPDTHSIQLQFDSAIH
ncbi:MAG: JAB domain-containing protein [Gammaproteobacteria bacterium]|nr:JAB domain-containing protein [Gammaproteobacteria bacterium]